MSETYYPVALVYDSEQTTISVGHLTQSQIDRMLADSTIIWLCQFLPIDGMTYLYPDEIKGDNRDFHRQAVEYAQSNLPT